ncbi:MAG: GumC family protein [Isosphaerales bacterium]
MDTKERLDSNAPGRGPSASDPAPVTSPDPAAKPVPRTKSRGIMHRLLARWWQILLLWVIVFLPLAFLITLLIQPTYEAFSILRVEPFPPKLFDPIRQDFPDPRFIKPYLQTQVNLITSDRVLTQAIANPLVVKLPVITESKDPRADLRKRLSVEIIDNAYLIRVALELADGNHAATIVDAVVQSYLIYNTEYERSANSTLKASLTAQLQILENEIKKKTGELAALYKKGTVEVATPSLTPSVPKNNGDTTQPTFSAVTEEQVQRLVDEVVRTDLALIEAQAILDVRQAANRATEEENAQRSHEAETKLDDRIREEFQRDPAVVALIAELVDTKEQLDRAKPGAPLDNDPARRAAQKQFKKLMQQYAELWSHRYDELRARLKVAVGTLQSDEAINELKIRLAALHKKKEEQAKLFSKLKIEKKAVNNDTFEATFLNQEVNGLLRSMEKVKANLQQLEFEASQEPYRVLLVDPASVPKTPTNNNRLKYMAAVPSIVFFLILGLFLVREIVAGREAAPDPARQLA